MRELNRGELLKAILAVAERHPNTRLSKLIKCVEAERSQKNIVLLLIELAEHANFASDISISLKYYLDMFEELPEEPQFSEAGLLLLNSAIIYGKRVDNVRLSVERLILSLINSESKEAERHELDENLDTISTPTIAKKGRKRPLEQLNTPYEAEMITKRFKILSTSKRFDDGSLAKKNINAFMENRKKDSTISFSKDFIHPTIWKYSVIEDYDYDDELDSKKNYKLFTYHLEHRYNTLIPDINFKMYFKMKDFIHAECRDSSNAELWPPLSDAYIDHYVNLENQILHKEGHDAKNQYITKERTRQITEQISIRRQSELRPVPILRDLQISEDSLCSGEPIANSEQPVNSQQIHVVTPCNENEHQDINADSAIGLDCSNDNAFTDTSISIDTFEESRLTSDQSACNKSTNDSAIDCNTYAESQIEETVTEINIGNDSTLQKEALSKTEKDSTLLDPESDNIDLTTIKVILPHLDDEGVFFSDLDERDQQMLSPAVVATDVFKCIKDKSNIIVIVDDVIKRIYNIQEPRQQILSLPVLSCPEYPSLPLNILKIHHKYFKKRRIFKLGSEFHLLKKERHKKNNREVKNPTQTRMHVRLFEDVIGVPLSPNSSPNSSPNHEPDFYGFPEEVSSDKNRTLSRDSGISLQQIESTSDKEINAEECKDILHSTLMLEPEHLSCNQEIANTLGESIVSTEITSNQISVEKEISERILNTEIAEAENSCNELTSLPYDNTDDSIETLPGITISENLTSVMSKVQEWHAHLQPILAQSRDRHHFDVFELGTEIINQFERCDNNRVISLNQVMENKDSSLISRYFLSTLLLANQGNISINVQNKGSETPSELHEIELNLLTKKRNIVCLEDNIGFRTPQMSNKRPFQEAEIANIRTLKPVPTVPITEDRDSGISSMSDRCSI